MSDIKSIMRSDYKLCKGCLQYIKKEENQCPFCKAGDHSISEEYSSRNLRIKELIWQVEKKIERYELAQFLKDTEQMVSVGR